MYDVKKLLDNIVRVLIELPYNEVQMLALNCSNNI